MGKPRCRIRWRVYIHYERSGVCKPVWRVSLDPPLVLGVLWWGKPHLRILNYHPMGCFGASFILIFFVSSIGYINCKQPLAVS